MSKFSVGDRVLLLRDFPGYGLNKGLIGLVSDVLEVVAMELSPILIDGNDPVYRIVFELNEGITIVNLPHINPYNNANFQKVQPKPEPTELESLRREISRLKAQVDRLEKTPKPSEKKQPFRPTIGKLVSYVAAPGDSIKWKTGDIIEPLAYRTREDNGVEVLVCWNITRGEALQRTLDVLGKGLFKPMGEQQ